MRNWLTLTLLVAGTLSAQTPPAFDAASIHVLEPPFQRLKTLTVSGTRVLFDGYGITWLVSEAYGLKDYQISTAQVPRAQLGIYYRIEARAPGADTPDKEQIRNMLRTLLAERFHLTLHRETKTTPVYALVIG